MSWKANMHLLNSELEKTGNHLELETCRVSEEPFTLLSIVHMLSSLPRVTEDSEGHLRPPPTHATQEDTASRWDASL